MSALVILFLAFDVVFKFVTPAPPPVVEAMAHLGWSLSLAPVLGIILLVSTALYVIPITSVLGAILLTGYLGGAIATHLRVGDPLFSHVLFRRIWACCSGVVSTCANPVCARYSRCAARRRFCFTFLISNFFPAGCTKHA